MSAREKSTQTVFVILHHDGQGIGGLVECYTAQQVPYQAIVKSDSDNYSRAPHSKMTLGGVNTTL